jgi:tRNA (guanine-N7-)-methyltransferase
VGEDRSRGQAPQSVLNEAEGAAHARGAFFGRRKGHRLRKTQSRLFETLLPQLALDLEATAPADLATLFPHKPSRIRLEIGFGGGEHLLHEARLFPQDGLIGCEPFINGMAKVLASLNEAPRENVRLHAGDAMPLLDWLPEAGLDRIDLLYADPWPKKRHWKRRFVSDENVRRFARALKIGGELRFASDIETYVEWTLLRLLRAEAFHWTAARASDWEQPWPGFPGTRYEAKALKRGAKPTYLTFRRV